MKLTWNKSIHPGFIILFNPFRIDIDALSESFEKTNDIISTVSVTAEDIAIQVRKLDLEQTKIKKTLQLLHDANELEVLN